MELDRAYKTMEHQNLFANIPEDLSTEFFQTLVSSAEIRIERIVSKSHKSDRDFWYNQDQNEWVGLINKERLGWNLSLAEPLLRRIEM
jgi:hypothetical protein